MVHFVLYLPRVRPGRPKEILKPLRMPQYSRAKNSQRVPDEPHYYARCRHDAPHYSRTDIEVDLTSINCDGNIPILSQVFLFLFFFCYLFALLHGISASMKTQLSHHSTLGLQTCFFVSLQTLLVCPSLRFIWRSRQAYHLPTGSSRHKNRAGTKAVPRHFHFPL